MGGAGEDPDEGRFAGAVLADEAMDLAARDRKIDGAQRCHAGVSLLDPTHFEDWHEARFGGPLCVSRGYRHGTTLTYLIILLSDN
jgi:hypothetical protein